MSDSDNAGAEALGAAARSGKLSFEPGFAREAAGTYQDLVDMLRAKQREIGRIRELSGFGGFGSAQELQEGFKGKIDQTGDAIGGLVEACYRMQEAHLATGKLYDEAEERHNAALREAAHRLEKNA